MAPPGASGGAGGAARAAARSGGIVRRGLFTGPGDFLDGPLDDVVGLALFSPDRLAAAREALDDEAAGYVRSGDAARWDTASASDIRADIVVMAERLRACSDLALRCGYSPDQRPHDLHPERCWRCDAADATGDLGCCAPCLADLRSATSPE